MKKNTFLILILICTFLFFSCSAKKLPPPEASYAEDAIEIHVKADYQLNSSDGQAHSLMLCTYQLKDPNALNQLADNQDGLYQLLECRLFDNSAVGAKRLIIQPGDNTVHNLNRAEGAKYVAVIAGYYGVQKERILRLYEIPVAEKKGMIKELINKTESQKLDKLEIELKLGAQQIE